MKERRASETAKGVAAHRAMEAEKAPSVRILDDTITREMLGPRWTVIGVSRLPQRVALWISELFVPGLHDYVVARARHIDDRVKDAVRDGATQLVILGAGFDSRAYRLDGLRGLVRVFEVDHPASQQEKRDAVARVLGTPPEHVTYVPVDFHTQGLADRLRECGYREDQRTLFVMEGVTMYLQPDAVDETLAFVREHSGSGSSIVFDYTYPEVLSGTFPHKTARNLKKAVDRVGEPFAFGISTGGAAAFLSERGFALLQDVDHAGLDQAYFVGQGSRRACPIFSIAHAAVIR